MNIPWQAVGKKRFYIVPIISLLIISVGIIFFTRPGVYIISDEAELFIYGKNRAMLQTLKAASSLFRPVSIVTMPQTADVDLQLVYIEKSAPSPWALIVPIRYQPVAEAFSQKHPKAEVLLWGRGSTSSFLSSFSVDYAADLSRAAKIAGPLASKMGIPPAIMFPRAFDAEYRNQLKLVFDQGLSAYGVSQGALILEKGSERITALSSVTYFPSDSSLQSLSAPMILFSGIRKDLLPNSVIAVFDDSLWPHIAAVASGKKPFNSLLYNKR